METPISFVGRPRFIKRDIPQVIHRKWRLKGKSWTWNTQLGHSGRCHWAVAAVYPWWLIRSWMFRDYAPLDIFWIITNEWTGNPFLNQYRGTAEGFEHGSIVFVWHCRWSPEDMINNRGISYGILNYGIYIFNPIYLYILFIFYVIIYII